MQNAAVRGDLEAAIGHGQRLLADDPLRETVHREVMRLYFRNGQRAEAIRQYERCARLLAEELEVEPMPETRALLLEITERPADPAWSASSAATRLDLAIGQLRQALAEFQRAETQLSAAIKDVAALRAGRPGAR
jgi:DNA-binding SARP family transcriptional activator